MTSTTESGRWRAPVHCDGPGSRTQLPVLPLDETRESEAGILVQAYSDGNAALDAAHAGIGPACDALARTYWAADQAVERLHHFIRSGGAFRAHRQVHRIDQRHAADGPEDRRRRPWWARDRVVWPAVAVSACYDTVFLADILSQLLDLSGTAAYVSYLPGVGIAVGLVVTAWLLATAYARRRLRAERTLSRALFGRYFRRERKEDDLPWPMWGLAVLFGLGFIGILAVWARNRAVLSGMDPLDWPLDQLEYPIAGLLLLLTLATVALKVIAHNPYADDDEAARKAVTRVEKQTDELRAMATTKLAEHSVAWSALQQVLAGTSAQAERFVETGRARVLELRSARMVPGKPLVDRLTPLTAGLWPAAGEDGRGTSLVEQLRLHTEVLDYARELVAKHAPAGLETRLAAIDERLLTQLGGAEGD
ncbi:hypothetical protein [Symbioplanes lichenis]|uniref:hypothetical protein n=1 Tax=Symbioplanes lichenis TaxID=1629072 RepID=UPI002739E541|nr:hypothetical protein [Actinoplanes lichenis]